MKVINIFIFLISFIFLPFAYGDHQLWHVDVRVDKNQLNKTELKGQLLFNKNCASCHGQNGSGSLSGPPLIHKIYEPGHHNNESFRRAINKGVRSHHWNFGNMPLQKQVAFGHVSPIITFVRALQKQNGAIK